MPPVVNIGPLALASDRLLAVVLMMAFVAAFDWLVGRRAPGATTLTSTLVLAAGILSARAVYVIAHAGAFAASPLSALAIWQGGFIAWAGFVAAGAVLAWRLRESRLKVQALALLGAAAFAWYGGLALLMPPPKPMPALPQLERIDGTQVAPASLAGKPYVVNLWATWCPPCRRELPMLADVAHSSRVPILLVNQGEDRATVEKFLKQQGIPAGHILLDRDAALARSVDASGLPVTLFVDAEGKIAVGHFGEVSRAAVQEGISRIDD